MRDVSYETELINQNQWEEKIKILFEFKSTHDLPYSFHAIKWKKVLDIFREQKPQAIKPQQVNRSEIYTLRV